VLYALEMPDGMRRVLFYMLEAAEGELRLPEVVEVCAVRFSVCWRTWSVRSVC